MTDPNDPYPSGVMEALVNERSLLKKVREVAKREALRAELKIRREIIEKRMKSEPVAGAPFPEDCLAKLMRNEVLEKILLRLTDPVDVISAYKACSTFQNILEPKRKAVLLPEVLNIFFDQKFGFNPETAFDQILSLRLVSKSWKKVVDKYLFGEEENTKCKWYFKNISWDCRNFSRDRTLSLNTITMIERAVSVLSTMSESDRKLFSGRLGIGPDFSAYGRLGNERNYVNEFYARVSEFLERFGNSVWEFDLFLRDLPMGEAYGLLVYWATLMPGIKTLDVMFDGIDTIEDAPDFCRRITRQSFPSLPLLRKCHCRADIWGRLYECTILSEIIQANPWIVDTVLHSLNDEQDDNDDDWERLFQLTNGDENFPRLGYRNLDKLKLETADVFGFLRELTIGTWPLKKLILDLDPDVSGLEYATFGIIARNLKNLKGTLTHLEIDCVHWSGDSVMEYLDLPNLKTLEMSMSLKDPGLDFLLPMKSLESLNFFSQELFNKDEFFRDYRSKLFRLDETEKIRFKGLLLRMEDSNITQVFPFLQKMEIRGNCHRIRYFREADVLKLTEKDRSILANIQRESNQGGNDLR